MSKFTDELHKQYILWVHYLNFTMAPWIFATAVGCFLADAPQFVTFSCIAFISLWGYTNPQYPPNLLKLKAKRKDNSIEDYYYQGFVCKNMGIVAMVTKLHLFWFSACSLSLVATGFTKSSLGL